MMPFSVLRPWILGTVGWLLLGVGIYCGWQAIQEFRRAEPVVTVLSDDQPSGNDVAAEEVPRTEPENHAPRKAARPLSRRFWAYAAASVALLGLNFAGFIPLQWLLHNPRGPKREQVLPSQKFWVERPDGSRLHGQVYGSESATTLLLTHGWSLDSSAWDYVVGQLSQQFRVVTWDLPGLGRSKGPDRADWSLEKMARDLHAVLEATATPAPVVLAGHSIGGMITQVFCRLHGEQLGSRVQGLALIHTTYVNPLRTCFAAWLATALELPVITPFNYLTTMLAPLVWLSNWQSYLNGSLHIMTRLSTFSGQQSWRQLDHAALLAAKAWPGVLARGNLAMQRFHEEATLSNIETPVLVIGGQHDRMTLPTASDHMSDLLAGGRLCQIPSGHLGMWECPSQFVSRLTEFVDYVSTHEVATKKNRVEQGATRKM